MFGSTRSLDENCYSNERAVGSNRPVEISRSSNRLKRLRDEKYVAAANAIAQPIIWHCMVNVGYHLADVVQSLDLPKTVLIHSHPRGHCVLQYIFFILQRWDNFLFLLKIQSGYAQLG